MLYRAAPAGRDSGTTGSSGSKDCLAKPKTGIALRLGKAKAPCPTEAKEEIGSPAQGPGRSWKRIDRMVLAVGPSDVDSK